MTPEQKLLGSTTRLSMIKTSKFGIYLGSDEYPGLEVLLPNNQVPQGIAPGDSLEVFLYRDSEDRLTATTTVPYVTLYETAPLRVTDVTNIGAFLNWGLAKDLFLPFKEQTKRVRVGDTVLAALYIDKSDRLCATMNVYDYLYNDSSYQKGDLVHGMVYEIIDTFGVFVAVDNKYSALIPHNEMSRELHVGDEVDARVKEVTEEGKLTLSLQQKLKVQMGMDAELILQRLENSGGFLPFQHHPRSSNGNSVSVKPPLNAPLAD